MTRTMLHGLSQKEQSRIISSRRCRSSKRWTMHCMFFSSLILTLLNYRIDREKGHLEEVTDEAHSLKGSSAAIALSQVESTFGEIDRFREKAKAWNKSDKLSEEDARDKLRATGKIQELLTRAKRENAAGKGWMEKWYEKETGTRDNF